MRAGVSITVCCFAAVSVAAPYEELVPKFDRITSRAMVRRISVPTLANLDYAAYNANPVRYDPQKFSPKPTVKPTIGTMVFGGALANVCDDIASTPLTAAEREQPLAWRALENRLWELTKDQAFQDISSRIASEKYGDRTVFKPFQEIAAAYVHSGAAGPELWVRIEFMPWTKFLKGIVKDDDGDGFAEIYGRLVLDRIPAETQSHVFAWIRDEYCARVLSRTEIKDWVNVLASYWYPTMNTDVLDMSGETQWPTAQTEKKVVKQLKGLIVENPVSVVRGNPFGTPIYNVYDVPSAAETAIGQSQQGLLVADTGRKAADTALSANFTANQARFGKELAENGGSYEAWAKKNARWIDAIRAILAGLPQGQMGFKGKDDWLFFRKSLEMMVAGELGKQPRDKNPLPHLVELKRYLDERNINLLFVVVPNKEDVYYEYLPAEALPPGGIINPYGRKILKDLQDAGVEVIDVLPHLLAAKASDTAPADHLYQHQDTHWTNRGLQIVAQLIADRIRAYAWYPTLAAQRVAYTTRDTTFQRQGDIVERLPEQERGSYPPVTLVAQRVYLPDGSPYPPNDKNAPILLMGDSFTGVFELVDCKSAGVGAHIAAKTGLPVDIITSWGGGPLVRQKALKARADSLPRKRLVIYLMVARDLYDYAQSWAPLDAGK